MGDKSTPPSAAPPAAPARAQNARVVPASNICLDRRMDAAIPRFFVIEPLAVRGSHPGHVQASGMLRHRDPVRDRLLRCKSLKSGESQPLL
jgi:hypothetical protein